jgi:hypothetical protein
VIHGGYFSSPTEVVKRTKEAIIKYQAAHQVDQPACAMERQPHWVAPPIGWVLVNWDVATDKSRGWWGLGVMI